MEIELNRFTPAEQATFRLRALYEQAGYRKYRASRFEEYALYQEYQRFLPDAQVITFTDLDGKLRAIKPDVTLSIAKTAQPAAGECKRFYYNEEVCRPSRESHTFQTIHQMGLESIGAVDADEQAADDVNHHDQNARDGVTAHKLTRTVHGAVEVSLALDIASALLRLFLVDYSGVEVGVYRHLLTGHRIQGKAG